MSTAGSGAERPTERAAPTWKADSEGDGYRYAVLDQAVVSGGNFLSLAIPAHFVSAGDQGVLGYLLAIYAATIVLNLAVVYYWGGVAAPQKSSPDRYLAVLGVLAGLVALPAALLGAATLFALVSASGAATSLTAAPLWAAFLLLAQVQDFGRRSAYLFSGARRAMGLDLLAYGLRMVLVLGLRPSNAPLAIAVLALSLVPTAVITTARSIPSIRAHRAGILADVRIHLRETRWLLLNAPAQWLWAQLPLFVVGLAGGLPQAGIFATVSSLARMGNAGMEILETRVSAVAGRLMASGGRIQVEGHMRRIRLVGLGAWLGGAGFVIVLGQPVLALLFSSTYATAPAHLLLEVLWLAQLPIFLFRVDEIVVRTIGRTGRLALAYYSGIAISTAVGVAAASVYHVMGGALQLLVEAVVILILMRAALFASDGTPRVDGQGALA